MGNPITPESKSELFANLQGMNRILEDPNYQAWGTSPIYDEDGRVHVFYSRWITEASHYGWVMCCEVAHAVADKPEGPYEFVDVALKGRGGDAWDSWSIHNPTIHKVGDKYALFYMGSDGSSFDKTMEELIELSRTDKEAYWPYFEKLVSTKRVGLAVADSLNGPWRRVADERPLVETGPEGSWDDYCTTNPAFLLQPNGECWLYYKAWSRATQETCHGNRQYGLAIAKDLEGPYEKVGNGPIVDLSYLGNNEQCEDAYLFVMDDKVHMVMRDMGYYDHTVGLHFTSEDGLKWGTPKVAYTGAPDYFDEPLPGLDREGRFERPQILMKDGKPECLFCAYVGGKYNTSSAAVLKFNNDK